MSDVHPVTGPQAIDLKNVKIVGGGPLPEGALEEFRSGLRGELLIPGDAEYDTARRVWNGVIDRRPAMIARCSGPADVLRCVSFARSHAVPLSVRGGGHNVAGAAIRDGGLVIDLSRMRGVRVDADNRTVRAEGGATLGDLDHETQAFGLAVPVGVVSRTGIGGLSLHGGLGFLTRRFGLASDNLVAADVVTADGSLVRADQSRNVDLFWALRGGGGGFGVVTSMEFRAHPVGPEVWMLIVMYPAAMGAEVFGNLREFMARAPDEFMAIGILWNSPPEGPFPEESLNVPVAVIAGCFSGPVEEGMRLTQPLRELGTPVLDLSGAMPFQEAQRLFDPDYPDGRRYYWKSAYLSELSDGAIATLRKYGASRPSPITSIDVWCLGGAMSRLKPEDTAFARRDVPFLVGIEANWDDPMDDGANIEWARALYRDLQPFSPGGTYLNFPGFVEEGSELIRKSYGGNYDRLRAIKAKYDPQNLFGGNVGL